MSLRGYATDKGLDILKYHLKDKVKYFTLIGYTESSNEELDELIQSPATEYKDIEQYAFGKSEIEAAYYDSNSVLTFEFSIDYESDYKKYIYAIGIIDTDDILVSVVRTPKIAKLKGIGGNITYKVAIQGEAGTIVFEQSDIRRATQEEAEAGVDGFPLMTPLRTKQYIDTCVVSEKDGVLGEDNKSFMTSLRTKQYVDGRLANEEEASKGEDFAKLITPKVLKRAIKDSLPSISEYVMDIVKNETMMVPVGFVYTQLPMQDEPAKLFGGVWENVSRHYNGCFFRAEGGNASYFGGGLQSGGAPDIYGSFQTAQRSSHYSNSGAFYRTDITTITYAYHQWWGGAKYYFSASACNRIYGNSPYEIRPDNMTVRIWKRIK